MNHILYWILELLGFDIVTPKEAELRILSYLKSTKKLTSDSELRSATRLSRLQYHFAVHSLFKKKVITQVYIENQGTNRKRLRAWEYNHE